MSETPTCTACSKEVDHWTVETCWTEDHDVIPEHFGICCDCFEDWIEKHCRLPDQPDY